MSRRITDPVEALAEETAERVIDLMVRSLHTDVGAMIARFVGRCRERRAGPGAQPGGGLDEWIAR